MDPLEPRTLRSVPRWGYRSPNQPGWWLPLVLVGCAIVILAFYGVIYLLR